MSCAANLVDQFWEQTRNGLVNGSIYAMLALGYTMVYGVLQLINFAHSEVFMISIVVTLYVVRGLFSITGPVTGFTLLLVFVATLAFAMAASGATAVLIERLAYRPLRRRGAPRLSFLIAAIGASLVLQYLFVLMDGRHYLFFLRLPNVLGPSPQPIPEFMSTSTVFTLFGSVWSNKALLVIGVAVIMLVALDRFVQKTRLGRGIRAVAQDPDTAAMMGVNIDQVIVTTFLIGGIMAGAAGVLYVVALGVPAWWFIGFLPGIKAFTAAVLGGIGNIRGAMLGGLLLGMVEAYAVPCFGAQWVDVTSFVVLVLVLLILPTGILGERVRVSG